MSKRWKIILIVIAAVVVLGVSGGAVVMAQDQDQPPAASNPLLARVAEILGRTETQLDDAIKSSRIEVVKEQITVALDKAVANGTINTADEEAILKWLDQQPDAADKAAIKSWWQSRPEISKPKLYGLLLGARSRILHLGWCRAFPGITPLVTDKVAAKLSVTTDQLINAFKQASQELKASTLQKALSNAVSNGKLTQAEADQIRSWWAQRPAALDKIAPSFGFGRGFCFPRMFRDK
jgi:hypothetical protein